MKENAKKASQYKLFQIICENIKLIKWHVSFCVHFFSLSNTILLDTRCGRFFL